MQQSTLDSALHAIGHRGPDGTGSWFSVDRKTALGHRRLSIIDLAGGAQPLHNEDGNIHLVINGELYDHARLRNDLRARGHVFATQSDSEIALHLYEEYGRDFIHHLRGEFALILFDARNNTLIAARDRFGIKPLCYAQRADGSICIASETKAIFAAGFSAPAWDHEAFYHACSLQYTPADRTIFAGIRQLPPGHMMVVHNANVTISKYWDIAFAAEKDSSRSDREWIDSFAQELTQAVTLRLAADVPVCTHLSGGIDSSTITALAKQAGHVRDCFTVRFAGDASYDETAIAQEMTAKLGITLNSIDVGSDDIADHLSDAAYYSEGISINSHLIGKYLLNRTIRAAGYKVALSGEGADELLAGYPHLREDLIDSDGGNATARSTLYAGNTKLAGVFLADGDTLDTSAMTAQLGYTPAFLRAKASLGYRLHGLLGDDYRHAMHTHDPFAHMAAHYKDDLSGLSRVDSASHLWAKSALANYILRTLGDGCEMPHAVEGRVPFLDHHLWEMARSMPMHLKIRDMREKHILREAMRPLLTDTLYHRQKQPFIAPPVARMGGARLRQLIGDTLSSASFASMPFFDVKRVAAWHARLLDASAQEHVSAEPVLMTLLTAASLHDRYRMAA